MTSPTNILGLIPARGGSKGIHNKNIFPLKGKPLLAYTCEAALASRRLTRIILNTDDKKIAAIGLKYGVEIPFLRPAELAADDTLILPVIQHALRKLQQMENYSPEVIVLLQPTSPLRKAKHIDAAIDLLLKTNADSVISAIEVPHSFTPSSLLHLKRGKLTPFQKGPLRYRRQDKPKMYARNGPAVLAVRRQVLEKGSLYGKNCFPLIMKPEESVDVDSFLDLQWAEFLLGQKKSS